MTRPQPSRSLRDAWPGGAHRRTAAHLSRHLGNGRSSAGAGRMAIGRFLTPPRASGAEGEWSLGRETCRRGMEGCTSTLPGCCTVLALGIEHRTSPCRHYGVIRWVTPQGESCSAIEWGRSCRRGRPGRHRAQKGKAPSTLPATALRSLRGRTPRSCLGVDPPPGTAKTAR